MIVFSVSGILELAVHDSELKGSWHAAGGTHLKKLTTTGLLNFSMAGLLGGTSQWRGYWRGMHQTDASSEEEVVSVAAIDASWVCYNCSDRCINMTRTCVHRQVGLNMQRFC